MWRLLSDKSHLCGNIGTPCRVRNSMDQASEKNKVSRWTKWVFGTFKNVAHVLKSVIKRYFLLKKNQKPTESLVSFFLEAWPCSQQFKLCNSLTDFYENQYHISVSIALKHTSQSTCKHMIFYEQYHNHPLIKYIVTCLYNAHHYNWGNTKFKVFEFKIPVHVLLFSLILWLPYLLSLVLCQFDLPLPVTIWKL